MIDTGQGITAAPIQTNGGIRALSRQGLQGDGGRGEINHHTPINRETGVPSKVDGAGVNRDVRSFGHRPGVEGHLPAIGSIPIRSDQRPGRIRPIRRVPVKINVTQAAAPRVIGRAQ